MDIKKSNRSDLRRRINLFFQIGLLISLIIVWALMEYRTYDRQYYDFGKSSGADVDDEMIPITQREQEPPPPLPPPKTAISSISIIGDEIKIEDNIDIDVETGEEDTIYFHETIIEEAQDEDEIPFTIVEDKPIFPGCENIDNKQERDKCTRKGINNIIAKNIEYPSSAKEMGIEGRVISSFSISKSGKVEDIKIIRGVDEYLDREAIRLIKLIPKMIPGKQRNKPVKVSYVIPIWFKLSEKD